MKRIPKKERARTTPFQLQPSFKHSFQRQVNGSAVSTGKLYKRPSSTIPFRPLSQETAKTKSLTTLPSDIVLIILDYVGHVKLNTCSYTYCKKLSFFKLCREWFGRFKSDGCIQFLFRYGRMESQNPEEIALIYATQLKFHCENNKYWEKELLKSLVSFPLDRSITPQLEKKKIQAIILEMKRFRDKRRNFCNSIKNLDFYNIETTFKHVCLCFEIFPNFEVLRLGYDIISVPD